MLDSVLSLYSSAATLTIREMAVCTAAAIVLGLLCAMVYMYKNTYTKSFVMTLALMPLIVQVIIMMVNGNIGTGVAVAGAFSLVRFRSAPGTAREIAGIFLAMTLGLACGMGYIGVAVLLLIVAAALTMLMCAVKFGEGAENERDLRITIPEDLDFTGLFDDLMKEYTDESRMLKVKTTNMGSMYELNYRIKLKKSVNEKKFIDSIRCRNANLTVICGRVPDKKEEL